MIVARSEVTVSPSARERARDLLCEMAVRSRAEDGIVDYRVTSDLESPDTFRILEVYEDEAAFEAHESSDHLAQFRRDMAPCLADEAELTCYDVAETTTLPGP